MHEACKHSAKLVGAGARAQAWANIDRMLVDNAVAIPWVFIDNPTIESRDVHGINNLSNSGFRDYSYTSLK